MTANTKKAANRLKNLAATIRVILISQIIFLTACIVISGEVNLQPFRYTRF